jgi:hypothetical protein
MHFVPSAPDSWFNLPREGGVAYAAQEAWVQNETIRVSTVPMNNTQTLIAAARTTFYLEPSTTKSDTTRVRAAERLGHSTLTICTIIVIWQCALERDLTLFEAGDQTEGMCQVSVVEYGRLTVGQWAKKA